MVDVSAIAGLLNSLRATTEIAKNMVGIRDEQMIARHVDELLKAVLTANQAALAAQSAAEILRQRCIELEHRAAEAENWKAESARYQLVELRTGSLAYVVKEAERGEEPTHYACPACMQRKQKSILQPRATGHGTRGLCCSACGLALAIDRADWIG